MVSSLLFFLALGLLIFRALRPGRFSEKLLLLSFFLFTLLTLALHPWVARSYSWLSVVESLSLVTLLVWLVGDPWALWLEKRRREKRAFYLLQNGKGSLSEIVTAARLLSERKQGGLIAMERKDPLDSWIQSGIPLDAKIRRETIYSVFTPPGALHDGGMIIRGDRIAACGVVFPLSKRLDLPTELGTRHRAALGLSEATDALAIVVSEETGKISLADQGSLFYDVKIERLPEFLEKALRNQLTRRKKKDRSKQPDVSLSVAQV